MLLLKRSSQPLIVHPSAVDQNNTQKIKTLIHEAKGRLFVLFCTDEIHQIGMLQIMFLVSLECSRGEGGVHRLGFMDKLKLKSQFCQHISKAEF
jgi:hypothetical protein